MVRRAWILCQPASMHALLTCKYVTSLHRILTSLLTWSYPMPVTPFIEFEG